MSLQKLIILKGAGSKHGGNISSRCYQMGTLLETNRGEQFKNEGL